MYKTRKSSGSASFLNRLQRNAQFSTDAGAEPADHEAAAPVTPESLLELLAELKHSTVAALGEHLGITPEALAEPLGQLLRNDCVKISHDMANPASEVVITPVGFRTAGFAKIARA